MKKDLYVDEKVRAIKRLFFCILLLVIPVLSYTNVIPNKAPFYEVNRIYLIALAVVLTRYYYERIAERGVMKRMLIDISLLMMFWFIAVFCKYKIFIDFTVLKRFCWYAYYIPMLFIPLLVFFTALSMDIVENEHIPARWHWMIVVTAIFVLFVLTNDMHQLVFKFNPGFENWDNDYSYNLIFYFLTVWEYGLYIAAFVVMIIRCRVAYMRKSAWVVLIPFAIGIPTAIMIALGYGFRIKGQLLLDVSTVLCFMVAAFIDACIQIGLIPGNKSHSEILEYSSLAAQITDKQGGIIFASKKASDNAVEWLKKSSDYIIDGDTAIIRKDIRNGYGFWQQDIADINRINEELLEIQERLQEESELTRLENKLKEKRLKIEARTRLYDLIAENTKKQSEEIYRLADSISEEKIQIYHQMLAD